MAKSESDYSVEKTGEAKTVHVRAHERAMPLRRFKFVCDYCYKQVKRETYACVCPKYGNECLGERAQCRRFS